MSNPQPPPPPGSWSPSTPAAPPAVGWNGRSAKAGAGGIRLGDALLFAVAGAAVAGTLWWLVTSLAESQFVYGAFFVGFVVGIVTVIGARRGGLTTGLIAVAATLVALAVSEYFIQRSLAIKDGFDIPLWQGFSFAKTVVVEAVKDRPVTGLFWALAAGAALWTAGREERRASF